MSKIKDFFKAKLKRQLILSGLVALGISIIAMFVVYFSIEVFLEETVYGDYYTGYMAANEMDSLQSYVTENDISSEELDQLDDWGDERYYRLTILIYDGDDLVYMTPQLGKYFRELKEEIKDSLYDENYGYFIEDQIVFEKGKASETSLVVDMFYQPSYGYYISNLLISAIVACLVFAFSFFFMFQKKVKYIVKLKQELDILAGGDLTYQVTEYGNDEIRDLAGGINAMRRSIISQHQEEQRAQRANAQLVTAMSHDLRSPLTSLIGYLEIIKRGKYKDEEELLHYTEHSLAKAVQIKSLSDQLFEYFLVTKSDNEEIRLNEYDADALFMELLDQCIFSLEDQGFVIEAQVEEIQGRILANAEFLKRIFDNIYSNMLKYAMKSRPIKVWLRVENHHILIKLQNKIVQDLPSKESTKIGLKTCERIMKNHKGEFTYKRQEDDFIVWMIFPMMG